jgi:MFS family permease
VALMGCVVGVTLFVSVSALTFMSANLLGALWGGLAFPLYTIAVAYSNDYAEPGEYVTVSSGLLLMYGIGAIIGPFVAAALMTARGNGGLFVFTALVHFMLVAYVAVRFLRRPTHARLQVAFGDSLSSAQTASQVFEEDIQPQDPD